MQASLRRQLAATALLLAALALGVAYREVVPPWELPDEPWHVVYAETLAAGRLPSPVETYEHHHPPLGYVAPALALRGLDLAPLPRSASHARYPFDAAAYVHAPGEPSAAPLRLLRALGAPLALATVALAFCAGMAMAGRGRVAFLAAGVVALLPQLAFIAQGSSNDAAAILVGALLTYGLLRTVRPARPAWRGPVLAALALALGPWTKLNLVALLPAAGLAWAFLARDAGRVSPGGASREVAGASLATPLDARRVGLAWIVAPLSSLGLYALLLPESLASQRDNLLGRGLGLAQGLVSPRYLAAQALRLAESALGVFGWMTIDLPGWAYAGSFALAALGLAGLPLAYRSLRDPSGRRAFMVLGLACAGALAAAFKNLMVDPQSQGRLLFPALSAATVLLALGWDAAGRRLIGADRAPWLGGAALVWLALVNVVALSRVIPDAMQPSYEARSGRSERRLLPQPARPDLLLGAGGVGIVEQTFDAHVPSLVAVTLPIAEPIGEGWLVAELVAEVGPAVDGTRKGEGGLSREGGAADRGSEAAGTLLRGTATPGDVLAAVRLPLSDAASAAWPWLELPLPAQPAKGPGVSRLRLRLSVEPGADGSGSVRLWAGPDRYPGAMGPAAPEGPSTAGVEDLALLLEERRAEFGGF